VVTSGLSWVVSFQSPKPSNTETCGECNIASFYADSALSLTECRYNRFINDRSWMLPCSFLPQ